MVRRGSASDVDRHLEDDDGDAYLSLEWREVAVTDRWCAGEEVARFHGCVGIDGCGVGQTNPCGVVHGDRAASPRRSSEGGRDLEDRELPSPGGEPTGAAIVG